MIFISDKNLLSDIAGKDEKAFNLFYDRYYKLLYKWAFQRTGDMDITDDITQNFWIKIWEEPELIKTDEEGCAKNFMLRHFTYRMLDYMKSSYIKTLTGNRVSPEEIENELSYTHVSEELDFKELENIINDILKKLPGKMAEIFVVHVRDGHTIQETAEILDINERTVRYNTKECIGLLKKELGKKGKDWIDDSSSIIVKNAGSCIIIVFIADKLLG